MTRRAISAWPYPMFLYEAIGDELVKQKAAEGQREAQWSLGYRLSEGSGCGSLGAADRPPQVDVGFAPRTA
jgi:hypothetical protein